MHRSSDTEENFLQLVEPLPSTWFGRIGTTIQEAAYNSSNSKPNSGVSHLDQAGDRLVSAQDSGTPTHTRPIYRPHDCL